MSEGDTEALAAEYVLGTLDSDSREKFAAALERDSDLRRLVGDWERRLASFEHGVEPVEPPAGLWYGIEAAMEAASNREAAGVIVRATEGAWRPFIPGVEKKTLIRNLDEGVETYLLRLAPGSRLPAHSHKIAEDCIVLEGELTIGDLRLGAGDYHMAPAGMPHGETVSPGGALIYLRGELRGAAG